MARSQKSEVRSQNPISPVRAIVWTLLAGAVLVASLYAFRRIEQFLILDPRFALNGPEGSFPGNSAGPETLEIAGAAHASHRAI
ncbi:MAG TPA: hypothetical protein VFW83_00985, partial [Bryobacteraceae bacterium]|nr:hypothetical protein [Bryobacteraceae bacterium]